MKQNPDFVLCDVADNHILMPVGSAAVDLNGMITLNDMGLSIWQLLAEDKTPEDLLAAVLEEYEVSEDRAREDIRRFLSTLRDAGCLTE